MRAAPGPLGNPTMPMRCESPARSSATTQKLSGRLSARPVGCLRSGISRVSPSPSDETTTGPAATGGAKRPRACSAESRHSCTALLANAHTESAGRLVAAPSARTSVSPQPRLEPCPRRASPLSSWHAKRMHAATDPTINRGSERMATVITGSSGTSPISTPPPAFPAGDSSPTHTPPRASLRSSGRHAADHCSSNARYLSTD